MASKGIIVKEYKSAISGVDLTAAADKDSAQIGVAGLVNLTIIGEITNAGGGTDAIFDLEAVPQDSTGTAQGSAVKLLTGVTHTADYNFIVSIGLGSGTLTNEGTATLASGAAAFVGVPNILLRINLSTTGVTAAQTATIHCWVQHTNQPVEVVS